MPTVGVFGGSFNPIHFGHLLLADDICEALRLDRVLFVPAAQPPHKPASELAAVEHRYRMTALAVHEHPRFAVSDIELRRVFSKAVLGSDRYARPIFPDERFDVSIDDCGQTCPVT